MIGAEEIGILIRSYLIEMGYRHSAFIFGAEAGLTAVGGIPYLPPGSFVTLLQRGIRYLALEKAIAERMSDGDSPSMVATALIESVRRKELPKSIHIMGRRETAVVQTKVQYKDVMRVSVRSGDAYCCDWAPSGDVLAAGGEDSVLIWDLNSTHRSQLAVKGGCVSMEWSRDGQLLATGTAEGQVQLWGNAGKNRWDLVPHTGSVFALRFSPDSQLLLSASQDSLLQIYGMVGDQLGQRIAQYRGHNGGVLDCIWLNARTFASCGKDNRVLVWTIDEQKPFSVLEGHSSPVNQMAWEPHTGTLASVSDDRTVHLWQPLQRGHSMTLQGHTHVVYVALWSPKDSNLLITGSFDQTVRFWNASSGFCVRAFSQLSTPIYSLSVSPDGQHLVCGGINSNEAYVLTMEDATVVATLEMPDGLFDCRWDPTGRRVGLACRRGSVLVVEGGLMFPDQNGPRLVM